MRRLEQKFYCQSLDAQNLPSEAGLASVWARPQRDLHFRTRNGALFLRESEEIRELVSYRRLSSPLVRESTSRSATATDGALEAVLTASQGVRALVEKTRTRHRATVDGLEVTVDVDRVVGLGDFIELSLPLTAGVAEARAQSALTKMAERLRLSGADALPYSYADLAVMMESSHRYRQRLAAGPGPLGRMIILDGASCSGKTTLGTWLLEEAEAGLELVPRYTTRAPRPEEHSGSEYLFTSMEALHRLTEAGELFEYRDFEFGMSYGLPWELAVDRLLTGRNGLGIMNLGNVCHLKRVFPEAVTVLIHAPIEVIERRLRERGMPEDHIAERLGNARRVESYRAFYDHVVVNNDGRLAEAKAALLRIVQS
jgi:guanylate kinase